MGEKGKSQRRSDVVKNFLSLRELRQGVVAGLTVRNLLVGLLLSLGLSFLVTEFEFQAVPQYKVGDIADRTIQVPRDVTVRDEEATRRKREEARLSVPAIFSFDFRVNQRVVAEIRMGFEDARQLLTQLRKQWEIPEGEPFPRARHNEVLTELERFLPRFSYGKTLEILFKYQFSRELEDQLVQLLSQVMRFPGVVLSRAGLLRFQDRGIAVRNVVTGEVDPLTDWLAIRDVAQARELLRQQEYELTSVTPAERRELLAFLERWIIPNAYFDEEATRVAEEKAMARVDPVFVQIKRGKIIVRAGDEITEQVLAQLEALQALRSQERWEARALGSFFVVSIFLFAFWTLLPESRRIRRSRAFLLVTMVLVGAVLLDRLFFWLGGGLADSLQARVPADPVNFYCFAPIALGSVLLTLLLGVQTAVLFTVVHGVAVGLLTRDLFMTVYAVGGGLLAAYALRHYRDRFTLIRAAGWIGGANVLIALAFQLIMPGGSVELSSFVIRSLGGLLSGFLSAIAATVVLPPLESLFGLTTDLRLLELSNLNHPLLRRLALEAPGTYHHSITVGTLAEAGAEAIGANSLLIRVGAYYHDVGKLKHPEYYVENQVYSTNKHETLSPSMSSLILASHVKDGLAIAKELKLGPAVSDLIPQHHGTRVMTYFYQKAREAAAERGEALREDDFRYPGPKPQTKEAAILMLADQVEAAARTLQAPTPGQIRGLIDRVVQATIQDGQLSECDITMRELKLVARAFERVLTGIHHHRIEYPGFEFQKKREPDEEPESSVIQ
ncbi:MAG TPA: HDIG domain-containing protein [Acidobacteriota bacterium]|jgi:hypothetical protein|nr:HDIG domain-containing protein [Acidobacteriota bacterium]HRR25247.1 HDIG domain-containing protein [Acidobacteriota bacterium]HRR55649.1 HDIG domain-containing protein [Acidobacteriota bacterium]HRV08912.1 HDIG domain-containing protein [Acidobacteriota bacterium]